MANAKAMSVGMALLAVVSSGCGGDGARGGDDPPDSVSLYSATLAAELCRLCLESYQQLTDFQNGATFTLPAPYALRQQYYTPERFPGERAAEGDTEVPIAFVATAGDAIYVVFRGTKTISEWIDDATFGQVPYPYVSGGGRAEDGFMTVYDTVREAILQTVAQLVDEGGYTTLYVTGHSLGAALATLAAAELQAQRSLQLVLYNFASPRVGNPLFATRYDELVPLSWRVANTNDLVPKLPPATVLLVDDGRYELLFYDHVDTEEAVTFGNPVTSPLDVGDIEFNHSACNYYATICDQTANPNSCKAMAGGADGCTLP